MFKRLFFALLGLGAGLTVGAWFVRRIERAQRRLSPAGLAESGANVAGGVRDRLAGAIEEGRRAMADRESELRAVYRARPPRGAG